MILCDYHVHSSFSDGKHSPREIVESACQKGLSYIGFSDHSPFPYVAPYGMDEETISAYRHEILQLKEEFQGRIRIFCGIELDMDTVRDASEFDYRIGSVHYLDLGTERGPIDESPDATEHIIRDHFNGDPYRYAEAYFEKVSHLHEGRDIDFFGHFDLLTKFEEACGFFSPEEPRYRNAWMGAVEALLPYHKPFEINTGAISRGWRTSPYPAKEVLLYLREHGATIIFGSDSHDKNTLCYNFSEAKAYAAACGFTSHVILTEEGPKEISLM